MTEDFYSRRRTVEECATYYGKDEQMIRRWCRDGKLIARKQVGGRDWWIYGEVDAELDAFCQRLIPRIEAVMPEMKDPDYDAVYYMANLARQRLSLGKETTHRTRRVLSKGLTLGD